jgi:hypothetical protein
MVQEVQVCTRCLFFSCTAIFSGTAVTHKGVKLQGQPPYDASKSIVDGIIVYLYIVFILWRSLYMVFILWCSLYTVFIVYEVRCRRWCVA